MDTIAETVNLQVPDGTMATFSYRPSDDGAYPAVIVIQEAFGVNDHIKDVARRFAAEGYFATAPDLFYRSGRNNVVSYSDIESVRKLMGGMTDDGIVADVDAVVAYLKRDGHMLGEHIGITGYCMGGRVSFLSACRVQGIGAAAVYYGGGIVPRQDAPTQTPAPIDLAERITCPVIGFFGGQDQGIPAEQVQRIEETLKRLGKDAEIHLYPEAGHGFFCEARPSYHSDAAKDAWARTLVFFESHLKGARVGTS